MSPKLYLPIGTKPFIQPRTEREELVNRLWNARYAVPGAKQMEIEQLRDFVDYAEGRAAEDNAKIALEKTRTKQDIDNAVAFLKEYQAWRNKKRG